MAGVFVVVGRYGGAVNEDEALPALKATFDTLDGWRERLRETDDPPAGSAFELDDRAWWPFPLSSCAWSKLASAVDHLQAVRIMVDAGSLHPIATFPRSGHSCQEEQRARGVTSPQPERFPVRPSAERRLSNLDGSTRAGRIRHFASSDLASMPTTDIEDGDAIGDPNTRIGNESAPQLDARPAPDAPVAPVQGVRFPIRRAEWCRCARWRRWGSTFCADLHTLSAAGASPTGEFPQSSRGSPGRAQVRNVPHP